MLWPVSWASLSPARPYALSLTGLSTSLAYPRPPITLLFTLHATFLLSNRGLVLDDLQVSFCSDTLWPLEW